MLQAPTPPTPNCHNREFGENKSHRGQWRQPHTMVLHNFFLLTGQWSKGERQAYWEPHNTNPTTAPILNTVCLLASHRVTIYSLKPDHVIVNSTFHTHVVVGCLPLPINKRYSLPFNTKQNQKTWQVTQFALQSISGNDKSEINLNSYQASKSETGLNKQD